MGQKKRKGKMEKPEFDAVAKSESVVGRETAKKCPRKKWLDRKWNG